MIQKNSSLIKRKRSFLKRAKVIHHNYDYSLVVYKNAHTKISIICNIHGVFYLTPSNHIDNKRGCQLCAFDKKGIQQQISNQLCIERCIDTHSNKYNYSKVNYLGANLKIEIICEKHGSFFQRAVGHWLGKGCPNCWYEKSSQDKTLTTLLFIEKASKVHNNYYSYEKSIYLNSNKKINITCPKHGYFSQCASSHLMGNGCKKCSTSVSKKETSWLDSFGLLLERQKKISLRHKTIFVDGFDISNNTIYEFYGDFWHGNPSKYEADDINMVIGESFGSLYKKTLIREKLIKQSNYKLITIWESLYDKK